MNTSIRLISRRQKTLEEALEEFKQKIYSIPACESGYWANELECIYESYGQSVDVEINIWKDDDKKLRCTFDVCKR